MIAKTPIRGSKSVRLTFTLPADLPIEAVSLVGDHNDWSPGVHELRPRRDGRRSVSLTARAGSTLRFRYLGTGGVWFDDDSADRIDDRGCIVTA